DYVNTFKVTLNSSSSFINLEYMVLDMNGGLVHSGTITDFMDHNQYPLPASLEPGTYNFEGRIVGSCGTTDWFEGVMDYANCGGVNVVPVGVLPAQYHYQIKSQQDYGKVFY